MCRIRIAQQNVVPAVPLVFVSYQSHIQREFTCFHSFCKIAGILCACPLRLKLTDGHVQHGVLGFGLSAVGTPGGLCGNVPLKGRDWRSVRRAPNETDPRVSYPRFCRKIHITGERRAWAVYRSVSHSVSFSELA